MIEKVKTYSVYRFVDKIKFICLRVFLPFFYPKNKRNERNIYAWACYKYLSKRYYDFEYIKENEKHRPAKIVWWCWLQGEEKAPLLCKSCLNSIKKHFKGYNIIVIDENNYHKYVSLPLFIIEKYERKIIGDAHFSDILRTSLLVKHGGLWIDATVFCTAFPTEIMNNQLFFYKEAKTSLSPYLCSNWFILSGKNNIIMKNMQKILFDYWENYNFAINYFIYHILLRIVAEHFQKEWKIIPVYPNCMPLIMQAEFQEKYSEKRYKELMSISDLHKLTYKFNKVQPGSFLEYILKNEYEI